MCFLLYWERDGYVFVKLLYTNSLIVFRLVTFLSYCLFIDWDILWTQPYTCLRREFSCRFFTTWSDLLFSFRKWKINFYKSWETSKLGTRQNERKNCKKKDEGTPHSLTKLGRDTPQLYIRREREQDSWNSGSITEVQAGWWPRRTNREPLVTLLRHSHRLYGRGAKEGCQLLLEGLAGPSHRKVTVERSLRAPGHLSTVSRKSQISRPSTPDSRSIGSSKVHYGMTRTLGWNSWLVQSTDFSLRPWKVTQN